MKIKLLRAGRWNTTGVKDGPFIEGTKGEELDVADEYGQMLIDVAAAEKVTVKPKAHQAKKESAKPKKKK